MTEEQARRHEVSVKWLTLVVGVAAFIVAWRTYVFENATTNEQLKLSRDELIASNKRTAEAREQEYKRRVWEKQLDLYLEACKTVTLLASDVASEESRQAALLRFEQLYHGELCVIESSEVAQKMIQIRSLLQATPVDRRALRSSSIELASACRRSIESKWEVDLGKVPEKF